MKILKPDTFYLLRGNHKFNEMCAHYGFKDEILNFHDPNKCLQPTTENNLPNIDDDIYLYLFLKKKKKRKKNQQKILILTILST